MKLYLNSGEGIEVPVDFLGNEISEGDILTFDSVGTEYEKENTRITPVYVVLKKTTKSRSFFFGLGLKRPKKWYSGRLYLHDFCFKNTIKLGNIDTNANDLHSVVEEEVSFRRFKNNNIEPDIRRSY